MKKPSKPVMWSLAAAAREFAIDRKTLVNRLTQDGSQPTDKGEYTTAQIRTAVYRDYDAVKVREAAERADKLALENARTRREFLPADDVERVWAAWLIEARSVVSGFDMPAEMKVRLLAVMRDIPKEKYIEGPADEPEDRE